MHCNPTLWLFFSPHVTNHSHTKHFILVLAKRLICCVCFIQCQVLSCYYFTKRPTLPSTSLWNAIRQQKAGEKFEDEGRGAGGKQYVWDADSMDNEWGSGDEKDENGGKSQGGWFHPLIDIREICGDLLPPSHSTKCPSSEEVVKINYLPHFVMWMDPTHCMHSCMGKCIECWGAGGEK